jgi:YVTN family beta-propeller protein
LISSLPHREVIMRREYVGLLALLVIGSAVLGGNRADPAVGYKLDKTVAVPGEGGWDYLSVDDVGRRVYVSHATCVEVLDADSGELKGQVSDTAGVHGIAVANGLNRGFTSNGKANTVSVFDLKTLKTLETVTVGKNPDAIMYDPSTKRVFAFNGGDASATVIDAATAKVAGTIKLGGRPESAVADGSGNVYVNLEDKDEVLKLDADKLKVLERWSIAPAKTPVSLALDTKEGRLFVGCRSKSLVVLSTKTGKTLASVAIGEGVDAGAFDPETKLVFCSCGDGTVAVIKQESADKYTLSETVKTRVRSKTMALDLKTHRLFVPAADFKAPADQPKGRPVMVPKTFCVLIYAK